MDPNRPFANIRALFRQALGQAPFIKLGAVHNGFDFRVLRQNRRVIKGDADTSAQRAAEIENFHGVLMDVSMGIASQRVREFPGVFGGVVYVARSATHGDK